MDEVLVERQAVDPEHPPGGRVDPGDVVASVDHDDPEPQVEQQRLGGLRRVGRDLEVAAGRSDRRIEGQLEVPVRSDRRRPARAAAARRPGYAAVDPQPGIVLDVRRGHRRDRLGRSEDEASVVAQREPERLERRPLHRLVEVDEDVPAEDEIDPRERAPALPGRARRRSSATGVSSRPRSRRRTSRSSARGAAAGTFWSAAGG